MACHSISVEGGSVCRFPSVASFGCCITDPSAFDRGRACRGEGHLFLCWYGRWIASFASIQRTPPFSFACLEHHGLCLHESDVCMLFFHHLPPLLFPSSSHPPFLSSLFTRALFLCRNCNRGSSPTTCAHRPSHPPTSEYSLSGPTLPPRIFVSPSCEYSHPPSVSRANIRE